MSCVVLKIVLKGEDWSFNKKYLIYDEITLTEDHPQVKSCIADAQSCLKLTADDAEIKTSLVIK
jgi:hypothetical protein